MIEKDEFCQDETEESSFDEECEVEEKEDNSYNEEEHFEWWFRYGKR